MSLVSRAKTSYKLLFSWRRKDKLFVFAWTFVFFFISLIDLTTPSLLCVVTEQHIRWMNTKRLLLWSFLYVGLHVLGNLSCCNGRSCSFTTQYIWVPCDSHIQYHVITWTVLIILFCNYRGLCSVWSRDGIFSNSWSRLDSLHFSPHGRSPHSSSWHANGGKCHCRTGLNSSLAIHSQVKDCDVFGHIRLAGMGVFRMAVFCILILC